MGGSGRSAESAPQGKEGLLVELGLELGLRLWWAVLLSEKLERSQEKFQKSD
jgi:hypothetical protein